MDLGAFADAVLDAVAGIGGDAVIETHEQAGYVLDALLRQPSIDRRELAAVFGLSLEQLERCRAGGNEGECNEVYANFCRADAVYAGNLLLERINQAAHWREEFRDMLNMAEGSDDESEGEQIEDAAEAPADVTVSLPRADRTSSRLAGEEDGKDSAGEGCQPVKIAPASARGKARALLGRHLDLLDPLKRRLVRRLEEEIFERNPEDKQYRHACRSIAANLRRNTMLAAGYGAGRVPPEWLVSASFEALAPRLMKLQRRALRSECLHDAKFDEVNADIRSRFWRAARGTDLAPPPPLEDPFG